MTKKSKTLTIILVISLIFFMGLLIGFNKEIAFTNETVYIPQYWTAECVARPDSMTLISIGEIDNAGEFFECTTSGNTAGYWIPENQYCEFEVIKDDIAFSYSVYDCPLNTLPKNVGDDCEKLKTQLSEVQQEFSIEQGKQLFVNPTSFLGLGKSRLKARYPSYGLRVESLGGFKPPLTTSCTLASYNTAVKTKIHLLEDSAFIVQPGVALNSVVGLAPIKSSLIVSIPSINGGNIIYVNKPNYYFSILEAEDGVLYADIQNQKFDSIIECVPSTPGCSGDAKVIKIEDTPCSEYGGVIDGYAPVDGSSNYCRYACVNDKLKVTSDCISFDSCDPLTEKLDYKTGECVTLTTKDPEVTTLPTWFWYLIIGLGGLIVFMFMMIVYQKKGEKKKGRVKR